MTDAPKAHAQTVGTEKVDARDIEDGYPLPIAHSKALCSDETVAAAIPLGLGCPLEGCAGHLYEALTQEGHRRLLCTDHRM